MGTKKAEALLRVGFRDNLEKERELSLEEFEKRVKARDDYKKWSLLEEVSRRQKSRELWLKEGDRNTGFFHKMANSHRRRNSINKIKVNGNWVTEDNAKKGVVDTFKGLLFESRGWCLAFPNIPIEVLGVEDACRLEDRFSEEEVFAAISSLNGEKASGPNGFPFVF